MDHDLHIVDKVWISFQYCWILSTEHWKFKSIGTAAYPFHKLYWYNYVPYKVIEIFVVGIDVIVKVENYIAGLNSLHLLDAL